MQAEEREDREGGNNILRELRLPHNARFLRTLPPFRLEHEVPERFDDLLLRLERVESGTAKADKRGTARRSSGSASRMRRN